MRRNPDDLCTLVATDRRIGRHVIGVLDTAEDVDAHVVKGIGLEPHLQGKLHQHTLNIAGLRGLVICLEIIEFPTHEGKTGQETKIKMIAEFHIGNHRYVQSGTAEAFGDIETIVEDKALRMVDLEVGIVEAKREPEIVGLVIKLAKILVAPVVLGLCRANETGQGQADYDLKPI